MAKKTPAAIAKTIPLEGLDISKHLVTADAGHIAMLMGASVNNTAEARGISIPHLAMRWLLDSDIIHFGSMYQIVGDPGSGKSQFGYEIGAMFIDAGGVFVLVETEHKVSEATLRAKLGEERFSGGRFMFKQCGSVDLAGDTEETEHLRGWQVELSTYLESVREHAALKNMPIFIMVDSLLGSASAEQLKEVDDKGTAAGRSTNGMSRAASIANYLATVGAKMSGTMMTLAFVNHQKTSVPMGGMPQYGPPKKRELGGDSPKYLSAVILEFRKGKKIKKTVVGGRSTSVRTIKNSFGEEGRSTEIIFFFDMERDPATGDPVIFENGTPRRVISWDWGSAGGNLILKFCSAKSKDESLSSAASQALFPGLAITKGRVSCKAYDIDGITLSEFGILAMTDKEMYTRLMCIPKFNINHAKKHNVLHAKTSYVEHVFDKRDQDKEWETDDTPDADDAGVGERDASLD